MLYDVVVVGALETNCYILYSSANSREVVVVDPGDEADRILEKIGDRKIAAYLLTHGHFDHTGALFQLPKAEIYISEHDGKMLNDKHLSCAEMFEDNRERPSEYKVLHEGDELELADLKFKVIETPGHTEGGLCFVVDDSILTGDTIFKFGYGRHDLPSGNFEMLKQSLRKLYALKGMKILPGHGEEGEIR